MGRDLTTVEPGGDQRDRSVRTPPGGAFDPHLFDTVGAQQLDPVEIAGSARGKRFVGELDAVGIDDADGVGVLVRVDPADRG